MTAVTGSVRKFVPVTVIVPPIAVICCARISPGGADGSRTVAVGATVRYELVPGALGVWEAAAVEAA